MQKVFAKKRQAQTFSFYSDDVYHLTNVLKYQVGQEILVNDNGQWFHCQITSLNPFRAEIIAAAQWDTTLPKKITLFQAIIKPKHLEWIIQKGTELQVANFQPVMFARSNPQNTVKLERLQLIAKTASSQCGCQQIPEITRTVAFQEMTNLLPNFGLVIVPFENLTQENHFQTIRNQIPNVSEIAIVVGPEGGFTQQEISHLAQQTNVVLTGLTKTILRSETASLYVIANVVNAILEGNYA